MHGLPLGGLRGSRSPTFQLGELLEVATLILLLFTVGSLVWVLFDLLGNRECQLHDRLCEPEQTRSKLVDEEKLAAKGRLASAVGREIRNPVAIISSAIKAAASANMSSEEREDMSNVALTEALAELLSYSFPGNIRELRNLLERACILTSGSEITSFDLPATAKVAGSPIIPDECNLRMLLADWERDAIVQTLGKTKGGKAEAARRLGLSKSDITYKLAKYGLSSTSSDEDRS